MVLAEYRYLPIIESSITYKDQISSGCLPHRQKKHCKAKQHRPYNSATGYCLVIMFILSAGLQVNTWGKLKRNGKHQQELGEIMV